MKSPKIILILILTLSTLACQKTSIDDKLKVCLTDTKFQSWFMVCKKETDTVCIYDNTKLTDKIAPIKLSCNKVLITKKSSIKIDLNAYDPNNSDKIVLYKYEEVNGIYKLSFLNIFNNANMVIELDSENKIVNYSTGFF